jgi:hypothetical protein
MDFHGAQQAELADILHRIDEDAALLFQALLNAMSDGSNEGIEEVTAAEANRRDALARFASLVEARA